MRLAVAGGTGVVGAEVVRAAEARGHEALVLSRARGVDLLTGKGLDLSGVDAVIDVCGATTLSAKRSREFFKVSTEQLLRAGQAAGVGHHLALSIVGAARAPHGYYAGKALQEQLVAAGPLPWTILRSTQFFEFAEQNAIAVGPWRMLPRMRSQPLAAAAVAERLVELAEGEPRRESLEIAGPEELSMAALLRAHYAARGERRRVLEFSLPGGFGRALREGTLLPAAGAELRGPGLEEWLRG